MRSYIVLAALGLLAGCSSKAPEPAAKAEPEPAADVKAQAAGLVLTPDAQQKTGIVVEPVQLERVNEALSATGELTVNQERTWSVGSHIDGRIVSVHANAGDVVKESFVLARIHSHDVHESRANYRKARDELARAQSAARLARTLRDRAVRLFELKAGSKQDVEVAEGQVREAATAVKNAETELQRARVHITEYLDVALDSDEDEVPIKAPASGLVVDRKVSAGTAVQQGQEVFRITDPSALWMIANVAEADLAQLRVGQAARVLVRAYPDRVFPGRILRLGEALDPTTRTLQVRVLVPNAGGLLKPEMYATAEIERQSTREALYVPEDAVQELNGSRVVFVRTAPDRFEARPIEVARTLGRRVEVANGLKAGEPIAVKGTFILKSHLLRSSMEEE